MIDLSPYPVTRKWPPQFPDWLQLYSLPTPNGVKVSVMLEECGIPYEAHRVDIQTGDQFTPEFLSVNPNNKIPAILDPQGPGGSPLVLAESGAILVYLAEKSGQFLPPDAVARYQTLQWLMFQMGGVGPMQGQANVFFGAEIRRQAAGQAGANQHANCRHRRHHANGKAAIAPALQTQRYQRHAHAQGKADAQNRRQHGEVGSPTHVYFLAE